MQMKRKIKKIVAVCGLFLALISGVASAVDLKDLIGVVGGGLIVSALGSQLNDFINTITFNKGVGTNEETKVVPIVSVGSGVAIGAAQVAGPKDAVAKVQAVAQLEVTFQDRIRIKVLIPIDSKNPLERFRRVQQVGGSAIIEYKI